MNTTIFEKTAKVNMKVLCEKRQIVPLSFECQILKLEDDVIGQAITRTFKNNIQRIIQLNSVHLEKYKKLILLEIIPHEVCHLVQHQLEDQRGFNHHSHGKLWHMLMRELGFTSPRITIDLERIKC